MTLHLTTQINNCAGHGIGGGISVSTRENLVTEVTMSDVTIRDCSSDVGGALGIAGTIGCAYTITRGRTFSVVSTHHH